MGTSFAFDLDGTLTKQEVLPVVADALGLHDEIRVLTDLTIRDVIPFEMSFRLRFALLKSADLQVVQEAVAEVQLDQHLSQFISQHKDSCFIVTGNLPEWIEPLSARLGCRVFSSRAKNLHNKLVSLTSVMNKGGVVVNLKKHFDRVVAVGEGANDIPMFDAADISIAYGGVHNPHEGLLDIADYLTFDSGRLCTLLNTLL